MECGTGRRAGSAGGISLRCVVEVAYDSAGREDW